MAWYRYKGFGNLKVIAPSGFSASESIVFLVFLPVAMKKGTTLPDPPWLSVLRSAELFLRTRKINQWKDWVARGPVGVETGRIVEAKSVVLDALATRVERYIVRLTTHW
jgi:hypothetical protein